MARDRQRAKQRRARRRETVPPGAKRPGTGPLDHGSASADEAAARLALGGEAAELPTDAARSSDLKAEDPAPTAEDPAPDQARTAAGPRGGREAPGADAHPQDAAREADREAAEAALGHPEAADSAGAPESQPAVSARGEQPLAGRVAPPARRPQSAGPVPLRAAAFLRNCWAELQRVQWPDRKQVAQATSVVLLFVIIAGAYLGLADAIAQRIVDAIV